MQNYNASGLAPLVASVRVYDVSEQLRAGNEPVMMLPAKKYRTSPQHKVGILQGGLAARELSFSYDHGSDLVRVPLSKYTIHGNTHDKVLQAGLEMGIVASRIIPDQLKTVERLFIVASPPELIDADGGSFNVWLGFAYVGN